MKRVIALVGEGVLEVELLEPKAALERAGATVDLVGPEPAEVMGKRGAKIIVEKGIDQVNVDDYGMLFLPGGSSPTHLREDARFVEFVRKFSETGRPIVTICHGAQLLTRAGVLKGRVLTSYSGDNIPEEVRDAGGTWVDAEAVVEGNLVSSRVPKDIPVFSQAVVDMLDKVPAGVSF